MYAETGRPSVAPERLLKSLLLIALHSIRSERQFCEQLEYNLLFRWFLDMDMLEEAFDASTFSRNRERLMEHEVATLFFAAIRQQGSDLMSSEHFSVDGTLLEAWASMKSFRPRCDNDDSDNNGWGQLRGRSRRNETHESKTDPEAKLMRKGNGREAKLCFAAHALMENRNALLVDVAVSEANGTCERETALSLLQQHAAGATVGADRGYDTRDFVRRCREAAVTPHVAQFENERRSCAIDGRTTRHRGYAIRQKIRKRIEQIFGWMKTVGGLRTTRFKGRARTQLAAYMVGAAYNLLRITKLQRCAA